MNQKPGTPDQVDRITFRKLFANFLAALVFERGLPYTCKELLVRPGETIYNYLFTEARAKYSKPFYSVIVMTALSTLVLIWIGGTQEFMKGLMAGGDHVLAGKEKSIEMLLFDYPTILALIWIPVNGLIGYLFFRNSKLYLSEHIILNTYLLTVQYLFSLLFSLFIPLFGDMFLMLGPLVGIIYQFYLF